jgi:hypothetical protein
MPSIHEILTWFTSGNGRLIAAAALFTLMYALKFVPIVEQRVLTTPRRRQVALAFLATSPAVFLLSAGAPWVDVLATALNAFLAGMGIHVLMKVGVQGGTVGGPPRES